MQKVLEEVNKITGDLKARKKVKKRMLLLKEGKRHCTYFCLIKPYLSLRGGGREREKEREREGECVFHQFCFVINAGRHMNDACW